MEALSRIPLSEKAADALLSEIVGGRWKVGDQLPGEMALAAEMHVGRSTIREAIRLLAARGMLATHQGVGVFLTATNPQEPFDRLAQVAAITDVVQVRIAIETRAAALAAQHHHRDDATAMTTALHARNALQHDAPRNLAAADITLHHCIVTAAHNTLLLALFDDIHPRLVTSMTELLTLLPIDHHDDAEHTAIVQAILARQPHTAEELTRRHLLGLAETLSTNPQKPTE
ncbi:FadR family transcriptional regulator [Mycobacterium hodleri]|uniref:FadR/GntR family transcriptional regulator n=1 Tax=Mycolicibacterium hodleri TaxID=49897 RepID=UPI0021F3B3DC|nr:GntR family transcriptional regulator [Mycolicibacterium hodleri]MCV7131786.1 FadR family transcriptional regulator [Mycolicibacterium hodleri]